VHQNKKTTLWSFCFDSFLRSLLGSYLLFVYAAVSENQISKSTLLETITAKNWEGYELIQAGEGRRLERFGDQIIERPEPNALWQISEYDSRWQEVSASFKEGEWSREIAEDWSIAWKGVKFDLKTTPFRHVGVFPEQSANWEWLTELVGKAVVAGKKPKVLNLFAYTGGASVAAALAGAQVCHADASKGVVHWASENARHSKAAPESTRWIVDDVRKFVSREVRRGNTYDIILLDPPVFGRGRQGEVWRLEEDLPELLSDLSQLFTGEPLGFLLNFYATEVYPESILRLAESYITQLPLKLSSLCLEESKTKKLLQTGYTVRS